MRPLGVGEAVGLIKGEAVGESDCGVAVFVTVRETSGEAGEGVVRLATARLPVRPWERTSARLAMEIMWARLSARPMRMGEAVGVTGGEVVEESGDGATV